MAWVTLLSIVVIQADRNSAATMDKKPIATGMTTTGMSLAICYIN